MPDHTRFKSVTSIGDPLISDQLEANIAAFFNWSFLQADGFFNVTFPSPATRLRPVSDPEYEAGRVWEGYRQDWVWESGVPADQQPVAVSGVWVNGVLRRGSGYFIDYPLGRVVFDDPVSPTGVVAVEHSFRRVRLATSDAEWFQQLQFDTIDTLNSPDPQFQQAASGAWNVLSQNRVQLPAVVIESVQRVRLKPLQIGSNARVHEQDVLFHVLAETPFDRKQLHDVVIAQYGHRLVLFDKARVDDADDWPLDHNGTPRAGAKHYPDLVAPTGDGGHAWRVCAVTDMRSEPQTSFPPLYRATCRGTFEVDLP